MESKIDALATLSRNIVDDSAGALFDAMANEEDDSATADLHSESVHRHLRFHAGEVCVTYFVMFLFSALLLRYTSFVTHQLAGGDTSFKPKAILPTFRALLWTLAGAALVLIAANVVLIVAFSSKCLSVELYLAILYAGRHFMLALAPAFMFQKSLSVAALVRAALVTLALSFGTLPVVFIPHPPAFIELYTSFALLAAFFGWIAWRPAPRASPAVMRRYASFALVHLLLAVAHVVCADHDIVDAGAPFSSVSSVWTAVTPLFVWQLLKSDTEYWRGKGTRSIKLQQLFAKHTKVTERVSAEGLHVLIEMHRKHVIDFSSLEIRQQIGDGCNSTVYSGLLRCKAPVSIKVYTPSDLSDEVIAEYSQEAALCGNLEHPNIVRFYGLSVCPPTISLVFELCRGSLQELSALGRDDYGCRMLIKTTQMLDAARAIAYLHSFSPPFIHRELSLSSFLVDVYGVVKLSGFGDSRVLNQFTALPHNQRRPHLRSLSGASAPWEERTASSPYEAFEYAATDVARKVPFHAPYSERIDVYALGMAFWQLLHPRVELPKFGARVYNDAEWRPLFADDVPAELQELIESTWNKDTRARPTAAQVVRKLEEIQQMALADDLECAAAAVDPSHLGMEDASAPRTMVDGADAVRSLVSSNQVQFSWEAVRLGNAWMEAGMLHEERHLQPFQNKPNTRYYFSPSSRRVTDSTASDDENSVIVIGMSISTRGSLSAKPTSGPQRPRKRCMCKLHARQLAQPRRAWRAFATAETRAVAQHDFTLSSSYESLLTTVLFKDIKE